MSAIAEPGRDESIAPVAGVGRSHRFSRAGLCSVDEFAIEAGCLGDSNLVSMWTGFIAGLISAGLQPVGLVASPGGLLILLIVTVVYFVAAVLFARLRPHPRSRGA
jgi:hypothetical protein